MSAESKPKQHQDGLPAALPDWSRCDFFCIHDYAGAGIAPCGWRGRLRDARLDEDHSIFLCPRCGCASLLRIPLRHGDETDN